MNNLHACQIPWFDKSGKMCHILPICSQTHFIEQDRKYCAHLESQCNVLEFNCMYRCQRGKMTEASYRRINSFKYLPMQNLRKKGHG